MTVSVCKQSQFKRNSKAVECCSALKAVSSRYLKVTHLLIKFFF